MNQFFKIFVILTFVVWSIPAQAKTPQLTHNNISQEIINKHKGQKNLQKSLEKLLTTNPEIQSLLYKIEAAKNKTSQAGWLDDPKVGVETMNIPTGNPSLSRTPMSGVQISVKQKVPFPSKLVTKKKIEKAKLNQTQKAYLEKINQLVAKFKQSYFEYAYTQEAISIHNKNKKRLKSLKSTLQAKYTTDEIPLQDLLKIKVAIGQIDNSLIALKQLAKTHQARLNTLLVQDVNSKINISTGNKLSSYPKNLNALIEKAKIQRPWIQKLNFEITEKEKQKSLAKQSLLPDFDFMGSYRFRENITGDPVNGENFISGGVSINLPFVWSIPKHTKKISETKNLLHSKKKEKQAVLQEVTYQVTQYFQELKQLRNQVSIMNSQIIPSSLSAFSSSKSSYEAGVVDFLDVISSQNSLFTHELSLVRYKYDYEKKRALLEMAVGEFF